MSKLLITSGCSFSDIIFTAVNQKTWPVILTEVLSEYKGLHLGKSSNGNGLISRRLIHTVSESLKNNKPSDILVGVMWSGASRHDFYNESPEYKNTKPLFNSIENPTGFVNSNKNWIVYNHFWDDSITPNCETYYKKFFDPVHSQLTTIEHILRTQWFLEKHNIKYFMSTYMSHVLSSEFINHPEVEYLYKQIDFDKFLPVTGEYEWCVEHMPNDFPYSNNEHPGSVQHTAFTEQVIVPFLKEKQYI